MATKKRRTKTKDWLESSDDDTSDGARGTSNTRKRLKEKSFVRQEKERDLKKTQLLLDRVCDSDEESDIQTKIPRSLASLPIADSKKRRHDSEYSSSGVEFQSENKKRRASINKSIIGKHVTDYEAINTPSKSDDEDTEVQPDDEISFKHYVIQDFDKIEKLTKQLKEDFKNSKIYLLNKKISAIRDSKFVVHKLLRFYDSTFEQLKKNRDEFVKTYENWIDSCSKKSGSCEKVKYALSSDSDEIVLPRLKKDTITYKKNKKVTNNESDISDRSNNEKNLIPEQTQKNKMDKNTEKSSNVSSDDKSDTSDIDNNIHKQYSSPEKRIKGKITKSPEPTSDKSNDSDEKEKIKDKCKSNTSKNSNISGVSMIDSVNVLDRPDDLNLPEDTNEKPNDDEAEKSADVSVERSSLNEIANKCHEKLNTEEVKSPSVSDSLEISKSDVNDFSLREEDADKSVVSNKSVESKTGSNKESKHENSSPSMSASKKLSLSLKNLDNKTEFFKSHLNITSGSEESDSESVKDKRFSVEKDKQHKIYKSESENSNKGDDRINASQILHSDISKDAYKDHEKMDVDENSVGQVSGCDSDIIFTDEENSVKSVNAKEQKTKLKSNEQTHSKVQSGSSSDDMFNSTGISSIANSPELNFRKKILESKEKQSSKKNEKKKKSSQIRSKDDQVLSHPLAPNKFTAEKNTIDSDEEKLFYSSATESEKTNDVKSKRRKSVNKENQKNNQSDSDNVEILPLSRLSMPEKTYESVKNIEDSDSESDEIILPSKRRFKTKTSIENSDSESDEIILPSERSSKPKKSIEDLEDEVPLKSEDEAKAKLLNSDCGSDHSTIIQDNSSPSRKSDSECTTLITSQKTQKQISTKKRTVSSSSNSSFHPTSPSEPEERSRQTSSAMLKRRQAFSILRNRYYKADPKLRMKCKVIVYRLPHSVLARHRSELEKSRKFVDKKKIKSLVNLNNLESRKKNKLDNIVEFSEGNDVEIKKTKKKKEKNSIDEHLNNAPDIELDASASDNDEIKQRALLNDEEVEQFFIQEDEDEAKQALLNDSSSVNEENGDIMDMDEEDDDIQKTKSRSKKKNQANDEPADESLKIEEDSANEEEEFKNKGDSWKQDELFTFDISGEEEVIIESQVTKKTKKAKEDNDKNSEGDVEIETTKKSQKIKRQRKKRILDSDSDVKLDSSEFDSDASDKDEKEEKEEKEVKKKRGRKKHGKSSESDSSGEPRTKAKRRRIKKVASDSDSEKDSPGKGRKNIRKVLKDKHVAEDTKRAALDEEERLKRIAERQRIFNEMYDARLAGEAKVDKLVLDIDEESKEELVVVNDELVKRLKPHQAQGIKFMWDACFESLKQVEKSDGSGCIIAHCMGLGKTFQVVTLVHTLLTHEETKVNTVMIVCPLSTVLNWVNEFKMWLKHTKEVDEIEIYELTKLKKNNERKYMLESWQKTGGVLIIGYEMFRNLTSTGKRMRKAMQESITRSLVDPGADLVVCDEGHLLKNEDSALSKAMKLIRTKRRVVLTGTPLQNNLKEYHCMVQFVKPNLLGTKKEFLNRFVNPITNGQFDDSTPYDVKLMKKRAHVLHKMLEGSVQRFDYSVLTPFLPPKQEYVIFVRLTEVQIKMYQYYLDKFARKFGGKNGSLFADFQELQRIWTHPYVLRLNAERVEKANEKKRLEASDSEGSLKDFIDDNSESEVESMHSTSSDNDSDVQCVDSDEDKPAVRTRSTRANPQEEPVLEVPNQPSAEESAWWSQFVEEQHFEDMRISTKLILLFSILKECEQIGDKVLVFSQSLYSLTLIEQFLSLIDQETQNGEEAEHLNGHTGRWILGLDYFRLDGSTSAENRSMWCKIFNKPTETRARLFLISTRAGGLGINLTAANRVIIFDASWNPSHDVQSIFRVYRFGQKKPCYIYRFLAAGTMEEKIYNRQVTKLSLACRVVDEQQIERHYSNNDLTELYQFEPHVDESIVLNLPKDRLLAEIFSKYKDFVYNYHEHDSLLENKEDEELDEEERKQAWIEYEEEKQGKRQLINNMGIASNMGFNPFMFNLNAFPEMESIKQLIQKDYPNLPPEHIETVARQAIYDMYRFVDQQAVNQVLNPFSAGSGLAGMPSQNTYNQQPSMQQQIHDQQNQLMNLLSQPQMNFGGVNQMPAYSGRGRPPKYLSMNNQMMNNQMMNNQMLNNQMINNSTMSQQPPAQPMQSSMQPQQSQQPPQNQDDNIEILSDPLADTPNTEAASNNKQDN